MSTTQRNQQHCKHCGDDYTEFYSPGYCSERCYHAYQGQNLLNLIQYDHCFCGSCGERLKEIEEPTDAQLRKIDGYHSTTAVIGYQYRTKHADIGEKGSEKPTGDEIHTGIVCGRCGNSSLHTTFPELQENHLIEYGGRILDTLQEKSDEHNKEIDAAQFFDALVETEDIAYALGQAIQ